MRINNFFDNNQNSLEQIKNKVHKIIAYHGSQTKHFEYDEDRVLYFTTDKKQAESYAKREWDEGLIEGEIPVIYKVEITLNNPKLLNNNQFFEFCDSEMNDYLKDELEEDGYDSVIYDDKKHNSKLIAVFNNKQFKIIDKEVLPKSYKYYYPRENGIKPEDIDDYYYDRLDESKNINSKEEPLYTAKSLKEVCLTMEKYKLNTVKVCYDKSIDTYIFGDTYNYVHFTLVSTAMENGLYSNIDTNGDISSQAIRYCNKLYCFGISTNKHAEDFISDKLELKSKINVNDKEFYIYQNNDEKNKIKDILKESEDRDDFYKQQFIKRVKAHIARVNKYGSMIDKSYPKHDFDKLYTKLLNYYYLDMKQNYEKLNHKEKEMLRKAGMAHRTQNPHHPEYWDKGNIESLTSIRSDPERPFNCQKMPKSALEEMCADWCAMSEEFGNTPFEWWNHIKNKRYIFTKEQEKYILSTLEKMWDSDNGGYYDELTESASKQYLYHGTTLESAQEIIWANEITGSTDIGNNQYGVSLTRNLKYAQHFAEYKADTNGDYGIVIFEFDYQQLKQHYKIRPYYDMSDSMNKSSGNKLQYNEFEEVLIGDIKPLSKYVTNIYVDDDAYEQIQDNDEYMEDFENAKLLNSNEIVKNHLSEFKNKNLNINESVNDNFKKWFGNSKVVDEQGNPLVVYHGTNQKFNSFSNAKTGRGYWFTSDREYASQFGKNIINCYLKIDNPFDVDKQDDDIEKYTNNPEDIINNTNVQSKLIKDGYDGIIFTKNDDIKTYIVFNPNQIKSVKNNGNWSNETNNINEAVVKTDNYEQIYYTKSFPLMMNIIKNKFSNTSIRVYYDFKKKIYVFGDALKFIHTELLETMIKYTDVYSTKSWDKNYYNETNEYWRDTYLSYHYLEPYCAMFQIVYDDDIKKYNHNDGYTNGYYTNMDDMLVICRKEEIDKCRKVPSLNNCQWNEQLNESFYLMESNVSEYIERSIDLVIKEVLHSELDYIIDYEVEYYYNTRDSYTKQLLLKSLGLTEDDTSLVLNTIYEKIKDCYENGDKDLKGLPIFVRKFLYVMIYKELNNRAQEVIDEFENNDTIYRSITSDLSPNELLQHIKENGLGNCWAKTKEKAQSYEGGLADNYEYLFEAEIENLEDISWTTTLALRYINEDEDEIRMKKSANVKLKNIYVRKAGFRDFSDYKPLNLALNIDTPIGQKYSFDESAKSIDKNLVEQKAYAGSRTDYEKPSLDFIGSGEGNQAHGWGLYYALNKDVAEDYRRYFTENEYDSNWEIDGTPIKEFLGDLYNEDTADTVDYVLKKGYSQNGEEIRNNLIRVLSDIKFFYRNKNEERAEEAKQMAHKIATYSSSDFKESVGQVHEVEIPENPYLLDEQKDYDEQSDYVQEKLQQVYEKLLDPKTIERDKKYGLTTVSGSGKDIYEFISDEVGGYREASLLLSRFGIKGITYDGQRDGRCFVIFKPSDVKILKKFYGAQMESLNISHQSLDESVKNIYNGVKLIKGDNDMIQWLNNNHNSRVIYDEEQNWYIVSNDIKNDIHTFMIEDAIQSGLYPEFAENYKKKVSKMGMGEYGFELLNKESRFKCFIAFDVEMAYLLTDTYKDVYDCGDFIVFCTDKDFEKTPIYDYYRNKNENNI